MAIEKVLRSFSALAMASGLVLAVAGCDNNGSNGDDDDTTEEITPDYSDNIAADCYTDCEDGICDEITTDCEDIADTETTCYEVKEEYEIICTADRLKDDVSIEIIDQGLPGNMEINTDEGYIKFTFGLEDVNHNLQDYINSNSPVIVFQGTTEVETENGLEDHTTKRYVSFDTIFVENEDPQAGTTEASISEIYGVQSSYNLLELFQITDREDDLVCEEDDGNPDNGNECNVLECEIDTLPPGATLEGCVLSVTPPEADTYAPIVTATDPQGGTTEDLTLSVEYTASATLPVSVRQFWQSTNTLREDTDGDLIPNPDGPYVPSNIHIKCYEDSALQNLDFEATEYIDLDTGDKDILITSDAMASGNQSVYCKFMVWDDLEMYEGLQRGDITIGDPVEIFQGANNTQEFNLLFNYSFDANAQAATGSTDIVDYCLLDWQDTMRNTYGVLTDGDLISMGTGIIYTKLEDGDQDTYNDALILVNTTESGFAPPGYTGELMQDYDNGANPEQITIDWDSLTSAVRTVDVNTGEITLGAVDMGIDYYEDEQHEAGFMLIAAGAGGGATEDVLPNPFVLGYDFSNGSGYDLKILQDCLGIMNHSPDRSIYNYCVEDHCDNF